MQKSKMDDGLGSKKHSMAPFIGSAFGANPGLEHRILYYFIINYI